MAKLPEESLLQYSLNTVYKQLSNYVCSVINQICTQSS